MSARISCFSCACVCVFFLFLKIVNRCVVTSESATSTPQRPIIGTDVRTVGQKSEIRVEMDQIVNKLDME
jgi:hypothetical protein